MSFILSCKKLIPSKRSVHYRYNTPLACYAPSRKYYNIGSFFLLVLNFCTTFVLSPKLTTIGKNTFTQNIATI